MEDNRRNDDARAMLEMEIERLREHAATSTNQCDVAKLIAISDAEVQARVHARLQNGDVPKGVRCRGNDGVVFVFACPVGALCLVPRSFLVLINHASRKVREIIDPFDAEEVISVGASPTPARATLLAPSALLPASTLDTSARIRFMSEATAPSAPVTESFTLTVEVPGIAFKALLFGSQRFDFFGADRLDVTLPSAGTYQFDLMVRDYANRTFKFKVTTSAGGNFEQSAQTDHQGGNLLRLQVTVP